MAQNFDAKRIGETLKDLRVRKGMTQQEIADAVGVSPSAWGMYESGERVPRDEIKISIANFFKKSVGFIFFPN